MAMTTNNNISLQKLNLQAWLLAFRPKTLTAALVPIMVGTSLVSALGYPIKWEVSGLALLASFFIQIATNLVNDAMDFKKGADTEKRIGPQRITQAGIFSYRMVMTVAVLFFALAVACGVPLVIWGGQPILWIGIFSLLCGYGYTGGPFPLAYKGLGDVFVILFFGLIAVMGLFYLHTATWPEPAFVVGLQVGLHATVLIAINNLRDAKGDVVANKRTLAVRFGEDFAKKEIYLLALAPFLLNTYWFKLGWLWPLVLPMAALPLAKKLVVNIANTEPSPIYNKYLGMGAGLHLVFGLLLTIGLSLQAWLK